jgi:hypothetical protein
MGKAFRDQTVMSREVHRFHRLSHRDVFGKSWKKRGHEIPHQWQQPGPLCVQEVRECFSYITKDSKTSRRADLTWIQIQFNLCKL